MLDITESIHGLKAFSGWGDPRQHFRVVPIWRI